MSTHTRTVWVVAETEEDATRVEVHHYWMFPSAAAAWEMIRLPGNAPRCYRCRPFLVTITATTEEAPLTQEEVDDLLRRTEEVRAEVAKHPPGTT